MNKFQTYLKYYSVVYWVKNGEMPCLEYCLLLTKYVVGSFEVTSDRCRAACHRVVGCLNNLCERIMELVTIRYTWKPSEYTETFRDFL